MNKYQYFCMFLLLYCCVVIGFQNVALVSALSMDYKLSQAPESHAFFLVTTKTLITFIINTSVVVT